MEQKIQLLGRSLVVLPEKQCDTCELRSVCKRQECSEHYELDPKENNDVTCFMYYIFNRFNVEEAMSLFGESLGKHIYDKFIHAASALYWYSELDRRTKQKLVDRAVELYKIRKV